MRLDSHCQHICPCPSCLYCLLYFPPTPPRILELFPISCVTCLARLDGGWPEKAWLFHVISPYRPYRSEPLEYHWTFKQLEYQKSPNINFYEPDIYILLFITLLCSYVDQICALHMPLNRRSRLRRRIPARRPLRSRC